MQANQLATQARDDYQARPYHGPRPLERGCMSGGLAMTRDSDPLEESNFITALERYKAAGVEVEVDHFGHWAVGWIDYLTVEITRASVQVLEGIREALENYPILDDEDFSQREWDSDHPDGDEHCYSQSCADYASGEDDGARPCGRKGWD